MWPCRVVLDPAQVLMWFDASLLVLTCTPRDTMSARFDLGMHDHWTTEREARLMAIPQSGTGE
jgi:hypothetical protein